MFWLEDPQLTWHNLHNPAYLMGGKTIVGALVGGLIAVELMKRYIGLHQSTGDLYAIPLALGVAIGRIGCFLTGLTDNTYGIATSLPWGVNFGDGILRHPTQIYEIIFLLFLIPILYCVIRISNPVILSEAGTPRSGVPAKSKDPYSHHDTQPTATNREGHDFSRAAMPQKKKAASAAEASCFLPGDTFKFFMVSYMFLRLLIDFIKPYPRLFLGLGTIQWACLLTLLYYSRDVVRWLALRKIGEHKQ